MKLLCNQLMDTIILCMKAPLFVRPLTANEQQHLHAALRSRNAFTLRRAQIVLASARRLRPAQIAEQLGCAPQTVRNALHAFQNSGIACLVPQSSRPKTVQPLLDPALCEQIRALLHASPRMFHKPPQHLDAGLSDRSVLRAGAHGAAVEY